MIRVEDKDAKMVIRWILNVIPNDRISAEKLRTRLKLNGMKECFQNDRV